MINIKEARAILVSHGMKVPKSPMNPTERRCVCETFAGLHAACVASAVQKT